MERITGLFDMVQGFVGTVLSDSEDGSTYPLIIVPRSPLAPKPRHIENKKSSGEGDIA